ncbi:MAG: hypothetical protein BZY88_03560 [SAR202 cluster bacterium Io17-Chloro-G9]|nr:MAG: hypothetical protein BZY88_03560 [SAR202 cluster bacterium Io17-Chloro-G9]
MEVVWVALVAFAALVGLIVVVAGGVVLFIRMRAREPINLDLRFLLRLYLLVVIVAGLLVFTQGASNLLLAGFAAIGDNQFSYSPVYIFLPGDNAPRPSPSPLELKDRAELTDSEREDLSVLLAEREQSRTQLEAERRRLGLERARDEGLIEGISFLVIGLIIWGSHFAGRRWLENEEERDSLLSRVYLTLVTITFGVITIVFLPQAVFQTLSYVLLDPLDQFNRGLQPGGKLALSITTLPIWIIYLWEAIRAIRRNPSEAGQPGGG